jgi:C-3',4' desaturase CrtD
MLRTVVIGAGIGGLSAAAVLARAGEDVTVLEAHVYPGGCAGTFYHQGYRFDAGATLAGGFYPGGPMDLLARATGISRWPGRPAAPAMLVHLPDGTQIPRWGDDRRWDEYRAVFGEESLAFWRWQENTAEALWALALRQPAWPPQNLADLQNLASQGLDWVGTAGADTLKRLPRLTGDAFRPVGAHLRGLSERLRLFVDAQLLISAQATSQEANALYGAAALDLPRRGVWHLEGGMGAVAQMLAQAVRENGGRVLYRQEATRIRLEGGKPVAVETRRGATFDADLIVANLTPWNVANLLGEGVPARWRARTRRLPARPPGKWGAFVVYLGVDGAAIPADTPLHHQVVLRRPLGEGNSVFLSISPEWDGSRAPSGKRALTLSTHTDLGTWWDVYGSDPEAYKAHQAQYTGNLLLAAEQVLPGLRQAAELILPGTPVTFQRFTRRDRGWVGGFQQTDLLRARGPRMGSRVWMVGDSIFPGQSVAAAALGGLRVAGAILRDQASPADEPRVQWKAAV